MKENQREKAVFVLLLLYSLSQLKLSETVLTRRQKGLREILDRFPLSFRL
jgi:hypothetical protein